MPGNVRISESWKDVNSISAKVDGAWKDVSDGFVKVNNEWKLFFSKIAANYFVMTGTVGQVNAIVFDSNNNLSVGSWFADLMKFSSDYNLLYSRRHTGATSLAIDQSNNHYSVDLGRFAKYNSSGNTEYLLNYPGNSPAVFYDVVVDSSNAIYLSGNGDFSRNFYVRKINQNTNLLWERIYLSGSVSCSTRSTSIDKSGNLIIAGLGTVSGMMGPVVLKINSNGSLLWSRHFQIQSQQFYGVATDSLNNIYAIGLGPTSRPYIVKINSNGNIVWQKELVLQGSFPFMSSIAIDSQDNVYIGGSPGIILKLNSSGNIIWVRTIRLGNLGNTPGRFNIVNIALDANQDLFLGGSYPGSITFGDYSEGQENSEFLLTKLPNDGSLTGVRSVQTARGSRTFSYIDQTSTSSIVDVSVNSSSGNFWEQGISYPLSNSTLTVTQPVTSLTRQQL